MDQMGQDARLPERLSPEDEAKFPNLKIYSVTSPHNAQNNCIAYATGDEARWWEPDPLYALCFPYIYWPPGARIGHDIAALQSAYECVGYAVCSDGTTEDGYEKVALYADDGGEYKHAARQLEDGSWKSKLGQKVDIRHLKAEWLNSGEYGRVWCYMKRPIGGSDGRSETKTT